MTTFVTLAAWRRYLPERPCDPALEWAGDRPLSVLWFECHRSDWLLWLCQALEIDVLSIGYWCAAQPAQASEAAEHRAIADHVRATIPWATVEAAIAARMEARHG